MKSVLIFAFVMLSLETTVAQSTDATVYFYCPEPSSKKFTGYNLNRYFIPFAQMHAKSVVAWQFKPGRLTISASSKIATDSVRLSVIAGSNYFVRCSLDKGKPVLEEVVQKTAEVELKMVDPQMIALLPGRDTLRAIQNFYEEKRTGGILRASTFFILSIVVATANVTKNDPIVTSSPGAPGSTLVTTYYPPSSNSSEGGNIAGAAVLAAIGVTGIIQTSRHSNGKLNLALIGYLEHGILPKRMTFKPKYFKKEVPSVE